MSLLDKLYERLLGKAQAAETAARVPVTKPERGKPYVLPTTAHHAVQVLIQHRPDFGPEIRPLSRAYTVIIVERDSGAVLAEARTEKDALAKARRALKAARKSTRKLSVS